MAPGTSRFFGKGCLQLFLLPHTLAGIGLLLAVLLHGLTLIAGHTVAAQVTDQSTRVGSKKSVQHLLTWQGEGGHGGQDDVGEDFWRAHPKGSAVEARCLDFGLGHFELLLGGVGAKRTLILAAAAAFWNGLLGVFYYIIYGQPMKMKRLVREGTAVMGQVTDKEEVVENKERVCKISYKFKLRDGGSMSVPLAAADRVQIGDEVVVLYGKSTDDSILYEFSHYKAHR